MIHTEKRGKLLHQAADPLVRRHEVDVLIKIRPLFGRFWPIDEPLQPIGVLLTMGKNDDSQAGKDMEWQQRELIRWLKVSISDIDVNFARFEQAIAQDLHHNTSGKNPLSWMDIHTCNSYLRKNCSKERTKEIFESEDLHQIRDRVQILTAMRDPRKFFYSVDQLTTILPLFRAHLEENRKSIVETGYPRSRFASAIWLDWRLSDLYRTKIPYKIQVQTDLKHNPSYTFSWAPVKQNHEMTPFQDHGSPLALNMPPSYQLLPGSKDTAFKKWPPFSLPETEMKPSKKYMEELAEYEDGLRDTAPWRRWQDDLSDHEPLPYIPVPYDESLYMGGISNSDASLIESLRDKLFDIRKETLDRLCNALPKFDVETLIKSCLEPLKKGLTVTEVKLMLKLDYPDYLHHYTSFLCQNPKSIGPIAGGLNSLLMVIDACIHEAKVHANEHTQEALGRLFNIESNGTKHTHLNGEWLTTSEKNVIDQATMLRSTLLKSSKQPHGMLFRSVGEWLKNDVLDHALFPIIGTEADRDNTRKAISSIPPLRKLPENHNQALLACLGRLPEPGENVFACDNEVRVIFFEGKSCLMKNSAGFDYISILLADPYSEKSCMALEQLVNGVQAVHINAKVDGDFLAEATIGNSSQKIYEGASADNLINYLRILGEDIDDAKSLETKPKEDKATKMRDQIVAFLLAGELNKPKKPKIKRGTPRNLLNGKSAKKVQQRLSNLDEIIFKANNDDAPELAIKAQDKRDRVFVSLVSGRFKGFKNSQDETLRKSVRKAIAESIAKIPDSLKSFRAHLDCIKTGHYCRYKPAISTKWTT